MRRGPAVYFLLLLLIASAYGAQRALAEGWQRISGFAPAHHTTAIPATGPPGLSQRLVLIIAEGLRPEDAPLLPSLEWLQRHGASYRLTVPSPVFPAPATATLLTGAPPELHGVLLPGARQAPFGADTLLAAAARSRVSTSAIGSPELAFLFQPPVESWVPAGEGATLLAQSQPLIARDGPKLVILQLDGLHRASDRLGSADRATPDNRDRLAELDGLLVQILEQTDLKTAAVMVTGTIPTALNGSHPASGRVPLIMAGAGVKAGVRGEGSLMDVAPTAAALLGLPTPLQSRGRPLLEALQLEGRRADVITERWLAARHLYASAVLQALGSRTALPDPPAAAGAADAYTAALDQQVREAKFAWWKERLLQRLPYLAGAALLLLLYLLVAIRLPYRGPLLITVLLYGLFFHLGFFIGGGRYGPAMKGLEHVGQAVAVAVAMKAATAMGLASILAGLLCARKGYRKAGYLAAVSAHITLSTQALLALPVILALIFTGWEFPEQLPATGMLIWFCITAAQIVVLGYLSPVWSLLTLLSARIARRLWPPQEEGGGPDQQAGKLVQMRTLRRSSRRHTVKG